VDNEALASLADPNFEQHFLVSPEKLSLLVEAADIQPRDHVVELGAGVGTVARRFPEGIRITVVELDHRLIEHLKSSVPTADVIQGDALSVIRGLACDVLISNLPNSITTQLVAIIPRLSFRVAVLTVGELSHLDLLPSTFRCQVVTTVSGDDFVPPQGPRSYIVKISPVMTGFP
jgi:16S rRNA A1518/A1519 N6-dimethyltransferase RsmA/KsgA/DIM1 with predicted DNA glycosylase/AP lyase activity